ncbi:hypothetical protein [Allokutzneria albata]|uniref:Ig-like domain-containing protein n=1 Tax=Allokutzneria albata TaxID=211114 RepID=A0A1G9VE74_ALLAB|nr:hypothetical protein [Allokutzneria albata]SDM70406.1 hypothetical protein SAMN04489726_2985 [Allokutzneria albata]
MYHKLAVVGLAAFGLMSLCSPAQAEAASGCKAVPGAPFSSGRVVYADVSVRGCTHFLNPGWQAYLEWRNMLGGWTRKAEYTRTGDGSAQLAYSCTPGETETYRTTIRISKHNKPMSREVRITC